MRLLAVLVAALVLAQAAFAHAQIDPASIDAGTATAVHLTVPTESETAATVAVRVTAPAGLTLNGATEWRGRTRGTVGLTFTASANEAADYRLLVMQSYSDGRDAAWTPVLHVARVENVERDRVIIVAVGAAAALFVLVLRRRRSR